MYQFLLYQLKMITKLLEQFRTEFKRSEMTNQTKNNSISLIQHLLKLENENDRTFFSKYYVPDVQIQDFNVLINGKRFFDLPIKNEEETHEQVIEVGRNNYATTGNLLDYEYFSKHYKLIAIDLSKQI